MQEKPYKCDVCWTTLNPSRGRFHGAQDNSYWGRSVPIWSFESQHCLLAHEKDPHLRIPPINWMSTVRCSIPLAVFVEHGRVRDYEKPCKCDVETCKSQHSLFMKRIRFGENPHKCDVYTLDSFIKLKKELTMTKSVTPRENVKYYVHVHPPKDQHCDHNRLRCDVSSEASWRSSHLKAHSRERNVLFRKSCRTWKEHTGKNLTNVTYMLKDLPEAIPS